MICFVSTGLHKFIFFFKCWIIFEIIFILDYDTLKQFYAFICILNKYLVELIFIIIIFFIFRLTIFYYIFIHKYSWIYIFLLDLNTFLNILVTVLAIIIIYLFLLIINQTFNCFHFTLAWIWLLNIIIFKLLWRFINK